MADKEILGVRETAWFIAVGTAIAAAMTHVLVHLLFITPAQVLPTGTWHATVAIFLYVLAAIPVTDVVLHQSKKLAAFLAAGFIWILGAVPHDGTHLLFIPVEMFEQAGVLHSGIAYATILAAGMLLLTVDR